MINFLNFSVSPCIDTPNVSISVGVMFVIVCTDVPIELSKYPFIVPYGKYEGSAPDREAPGQGRDHQVPDCVSGGSETFHQSD